jgi:hypothetical protein
LPIAVKFRVPGKTDGARFASVTDVTLDHADAASLPDLVKFQGRRWERAGGANSTNYRSMSPVTVVDLDREDNAKIIEV